MQYPSCFTCWTALAALLLLSACPETEPFVTYGQPDDALDGGAGQAAHGGTQAQAGRAGTLLGAAGGAAGSTGAAGGAAGSIIGAAGGAAGSTGAAGAAGSAGAAGAAGSAAAAASVSFAVTTMSLGGRYAPRNIGAIWIETRSGAFVKSLELWAKTRRRYLTKFNAAVGTTGAVDVTASATLPSHRAHAVTWDHRDRNAVPRSPGPHRLCVEVTDQDATGESYCLDFDSSTGTQILTPADAAFFKALSLSVR